MVIFSEPWAHCAKNSAQQLNSKTTWPQQAQTTAQPQLINTFQSSRNNTSGHIDPALTNHLQHFVQQLMTPQPIAPQPIALQPVVMQRMPTPAIEIGMSNPIRQQPCAQQHQDL